MNNDPYAPLLGFDRLDVAPLAHLPQVPKAPLAERRATRLRLGRLPLLARLLRGSQPLLLRPRQPAEARLLHRAVHGVDALCPLRACVLRRLVPVADDALDPRAPGAHADRVLLVLLPRDLLLYRAAALGVRVVVEFRVVVRPLRDPGRRRARAHGRGRTRLWLEELA